MPASEQEASWLPRRGRLELVVSGRTLGVVQYSRFGNWLAEIAPHRVESWAKCRDAVYWVQGALALPNTNMCAIPLHLLQ